MWPTGRAVRRSQRSRRRVTCSRRSCLVVDDSDAPIQVKRNHAEAQVSDWLSAQVEGTSAARGLHVCPCTLVHSLGPDLPIVGRTNDDSDVEGVPGVLGLGKPASGLEGRAEFVVGYVVLVVEALQGDAAGCPLVL